MFMVISLFFVSWMPSALLEMANYVSMAAPTSTTSTMLAFLVHQKNLTFHIFIKRLFLRFKIIEGSKTCN